MQSNSYVYEKTDVGITINKVPVWFVEKDTTTDEDNGTIILETQKYDDIWGPMSRIELNWEKKDRTKILHAKEVQNSIDMYNTIKMVVTTKETIWLMSHEFTYWIGGRNKLIRKRFYLFSFK